MSEQNDSEKKIIIDEDWKSQVEAERETADPEQDAAEAPESATKAADEPQEMPPASFSQLVTSLATQAMVAMGALPTAEGEEELPVHLPLAKHLIDLLGVLEEKTKRNLTGEEHDMLQGALHQLRILFVAMQSGVKPDEEGSP